MFTSTLSKRGDQTIYDRFLDIGNLDMEQWTNSELLTGVWPSSLHVLCGLGDVSWSCLLTNEGATVMNLVEPKWESRNHPVGVRLLQGWSPVYGIHEDLKVQYGDITTAYLISVILWFYWLHQTVTFSTHWEGDVVNMVERSKRWTDGLVWPSC